VTLFGGRRSISVALSLSTVGLKAGLAEARREMTDFAKAGVDASKKHKRSFDDAAQGAIGFGLAVGAVAGVAVHAFAKFDKSMARVQAATQAAASQMTALREAALQAGADTQFSATQAADAITELSKAGVSTGDILGGGLTNTLTLAAAGELEVARAAEIAATTMTQFALSGKDTQRVADALAAGAGKAQGSVEDLAQGLKYVGPVAAGMGISLEQTVGVLAEFASKGIIGEQAGTSFRGMLSSLTSPSAKAADEMTRLGLTVYDAQGQFIGMDGVAGRMRGALQSLTDEQRNASLGIIFGNEQLTAARILYEGGAKAVREWQNSVTDAGYASRQAGQLMDNLAGDVEELQGSLETAFISSGAGANEGLRALTQGATGAVNAFGAIPDPLQRSTVVAAGLTAGVALLGGGMLLLASKARSAKETLDELGVSGSKAGRGLKLLGAGIAAISIAQALPDLATGMDQQFGLVTKSSGELEDSLISLAQTGELSGEALAKFGADFEGAGSAWNKFSGGFFTTGESLSSTVDRLSQSSDNMFEKFVHWGDSTQTQAQNLRAVGDALANMVTNGRVDEAAEVFRRYAEGAGLQGEETEKLLNLMPGYRDVLRQVKNQAGDTTGSIVEYALGQETAASAAAGLTEAQTKLAQSLDASESAFLGGREASRSYQEAIDAAKASARENGSTLDEASEKGRANAKSMDDLASSALGYLNTLTGPKGEVTPKFTAALGDMRTRLIEAYRRFDDTKGAAERYAEAILGIPTKRSTEVELRGAETAIRKLKELIALSQKRLVVYAPGVTATPKFLLQNPDGGATGGLIAGPPSKVDNRIMKVATGEFIVNAEQAKKNLPILHAINEGTLPGFAAGGFNSPFGASDVQQRYEGLLPKPITPQQYAAALKAAADAQGRTANAADRLRAAERDLTKARRSGSTEEIRDAEDDLNKARRGHAAARRAESIAESKAADAQRRKNAGRGFNLGLYINALGSTTRQAESYRRNLGIVSKRGGGDLAAALEAMGAEGAPLIAALVRASPAQFKRVANLLKRLDPSAFGGNQKVTRFAAGGIAPAKLGGWRVFGEAGSDEAFIPLGGNQARSRSLTGQVASRLGGQVTWSSHRVIPGSTGVSAAPSSAVASGGGGVSMSVGTVQLLRGGPEDVARDVMFKVRMLGG
jgi:TP901 family phage tail tape measure protein